MKIETLMIVGLVAMTVLGAASQHASAETFYFCPDRGNGETEGYWSNPDHWSINSDCSGGSPGLPGPADSVIIPANLLCHMDAANGKCGDIDVKDGAIVEIEPGKKLRLTGITSSTSQLNEAGTIKLLPNESVLSIVNHDHTFSGTGGSIKGEDASAKIQIAHTLTLFNEATIEGMLAIVTPKEESSVFDNRGIVDANAGGTLLVNTSVIEDTAAGIWMVTGAGAVLQFDQDGGSQPELDGDFTVSDGVLDVDAPGLDTTGMLTFTGGTIDASGLTGNQEAKFTGGP